ncbi:unnamed protein product [Caenorhabditis brenneri]
MTFPLLHTPLLCIERILLQLITPEQIVFSFISKQSYKMIQKLKNTLMGIDIHRANGWFLVRFKSGDSGNNYTYWSVNRKHKVQPRFSFTLKIEEQRLESCLTRTSLCSQTEKNENELAEQLVIPYLLKLLKTTVLTVVLEHEGLEPPFLNGFSELQTVVIIGKKVMKNTDLREFIMNTPISERLMIQTPTRKDFYVDPIHIKSKDFIVRNVSSPWITRDIFMGLTCDNIQLSGSPLTSRDFYSFVQRWFYSDNTTFYYLYLAAIDVLPLDLSEFNAKPWCQKERSQGYKYGHTVMDFADAQDITRSDGLLASVLIDGNKLSFSVWHTRFPDIAGCKVV